MGLKGINLGLLRHILLATAASYVLVYLFIAFCRIQYPFELEWMEGGSVEQVSRILSGQKLYVKPSLDFVPYVYNPLYFYLSAVAAKVIGIGFTPLRLISLLSSIGCFLIIFAMVKRETGSNFSSILASSLFAATFRISGAWFDIARADSLFLFFLLAAVYLIKFKESVKSYILAGVLISLSFLTKQTALIVSLPIMLYAILINRRHSLFLIGTVVLAVGGSVLLLDYIHDGWYFYYIFHLPAQHTISKSKLVLFWSSDILLPLAIAFAMSVFYTFTQLNSNRKNCIFYLLMAAGMLAGSWFSRVHSGGYDNVLFPAYAGISIMFGLSVHTALKFIKDIPEDKQKWMEAYIYLVCIIQFISLAYNPFAQIPTQKDLEAGVGFINMMKQLEGDIFVPSHAYLPTLAGKRSHAQHMAVFDIIRGNDDSVKANLTSEIRDAIREKRFNAIIIDSDVYTFQKDIDDYYTKQGPIFEEEGVFWPVTGYRVRPELIYVPKTSSSG